MKTAKIFIVRFYLTAAFENDFWKFICVNKKRRLNDSSIQTA